MTFAPDHPFQPALGLAGPHAQTLYAALVRSTRPPRVERERWETPDSDFLDVDWLRAPAEAPHLLLLHGLEGSSRAGYVVAALREAARKGWGALALNFRSCSGEPNRLLRSYHSGETTDPAFVLGRMRARIRGPLVAIGFSLGANVLLRLLAETGERCPLDAAAAISAPFDLSSCVRILDSARGVAGLYRLRFLWTLKAKALAKAKRFSGVAGESIRAARNLQGFDDAFTAPAHGFSSAAEYYARCASGPTLGQIRKPTLLLSAEDDPMAPASLLPPSARENPSLSLLVPRGGGHVGFVEGSAFRPRFWAEAEAVRFLAQALRGARPRP